jgi:hypothetical protein
VRAGRSENQRRSVGGGLRHLRAAQRTTCARLEVHQQGLAKFGLEVLGEDAGQDVRRAARRKGDHQPYRARRKLLRPGSAGEKQRRGAEQKRTSLHGQTSSMASDGRCAVFLMGG